MPYLIITTRQVIRTIIATNHEQIFPVNSENLSKYLLMPSKVNLFLLTTNSIIIEGRYL